jgi:phage replication O-like protein O
MKNNNPQIEDGYTKIANELMDAFCTFRIPGEIRQVLDCILRKTYGWNKKDDWISNSQIIEATGLLKGNVSRSLSKLITHKVVIKTDNKLRLNKNYKEWVSFEKPRSAKLSKVITPVIKVDTVVIKSDNKKLSEVRDTKDNKDTTTKDTIQKKEYTRIEDVTETDFEEIAEKYQAPISFVRSKYDDMVNWHEENPRRNNKSNWRATLMKWVKKDAMERREHAEEAPRIVYVGEPLAP